MPEQKPEPTSCEAAAAALGLETVLAPPPGALIRDGYAGDLLSDVMANAPEGCAVITIQAHRNTAAVAQLVGASCIVVCNSREVPDDLVAACRAEGLGIYRSTENQFVVAGRLYKLLYG